ncbi:uncharacterized protein DUF3644 [Fusobacterium naviforme]|nr:DUF3644 domain-containing protein [Fusobacterium naviforme]PSL09083.1 uncharacterized protein DUF3644 [Fusobacterium naviforme]STO27733.1 Protein of uncharacterised function (DUF3644) [Fusobacterium naviforme]
MISEQERLLDKSIEAFVLGLEIYNKPTLRYRVEGFSFFIVNAWELMLKAEMLRRGMSIYYKDNPGRTVSIDVAIRKIYPDKNTRIRLNLEKIIELRNISTHYITEDYEQKYVPLFQACVLNYANEIKRFHGVDISDHIAQNFLTITANYEPLDNEQIRLKYSPEVAEKLIQQANEIAVLNETYNSDHFAINVRQNLYITKKHSEADFTVAISKDSDTKVEIVKELKDPADTHRYSFNTVITAVQEKMMREGIRIDYEKGFNSYVLTLVIDFYDVKQDPKYAYKHMIGRQEQYTYSQQFVEFIVGEIKKNPDGFVESLRKRKR